MPVLIENNAIVEVRLEFQIAGANDKAFNILHYRVASITDETSGLPSAISPPADTILPSMALAAYTALAQGWTNCGSAQVGVMNATVQKVHPTPRSEEYVYLPPEPVIGDIVGAALPMQDSVTLLKRTGFGERWGMGRLFVAGIPEASQTNGRLDPAALANYQAFGDAMMSNIGSSGSGVNVSWKPVLYHKDGATLRVNDLTRVVLSNDVIKAQKRRRPGKGI